MKNCVKGSMTIEAALLFPFIFCICLIFIQLALYFVTLEYAKSVCDRGLIMGHVQRSDKASEDAVASYIEETLKESSFISSVTEVQVEKNKYFVFDSWNIHVTGAFEMFYPMEFRIATKGFVESPTQFSNLADFLIQTAAKIKERVQTEKKE